MASDDTCLYGDAGKSPPSTEVTHLSQSIGGRKVRAFIEVKVPITTSYWILIIIKFMSITYLRCPLETKYVQTPKHVQTQETYKL